METFKLIIAWILIGLVAAYISISLCGCQSIYEEIERQKAEKAKQQTLSHFSNFGKYGFTTFKSLQIDNTIITYPYTPKEKMPLECFDCHHHHSNMKD